MKFNFKKIASILAGTVMLSSTLAFAAAVNNYPAPFVKSGSADVNVVYGSNPGYELDLLAVADITTSLQAKLAAQTATGGTTTTVASITGEAAPLFSGGTKLYMNDTLNIVKSSLTDTQLPTVLKDGSFSGNVDTTYTQTIDLGFNPQFLFGKYPTSSDDPTYVLSTSSTAANYIYNASVTFNKAIMLNHSDSEGQDITMFGQKFTIASATDGTQLVLLKTAEKVSLTNTAPSAEVTIQGKKYTVELVSASDTAATVKITNEAGVSETKEINENASKKVNGITIAITNADETNLQLSASIIAGAEKLTLSDTAGSSVTYGEDDKNIDGTSVTITGEAEAATKITISIYAKDSDADALKSGGTFIDPVFGTFKLNFAGLSIPENSTIREDIILSNNGDDKLQVKFTNYQGKTKAISFVKNNTGTNDLQYDDNGKNISVAEMEKLTKDAYVVVGNEDEAELLKITKISNSSTAGTSGDTITYVNVFTDISANMDIGSSDGTATLNVGGKAFTVTYNGSTSADTNYLRINHPDSTGNDMVIYPTIETSKGAKLAFYKPLTINVSSWNGDIWANLSNLKFPDGDGYTSIGIISNIASSITEGINITCSGASAVIMSNSTSTSCALGKLTYNFSLNTITGVDNATLLVRLNNPQGGGAITTPAIAIFEEKDDNAEYQAIVATPEVGINADDGMGVSDVINTWGSDGRWDAISLYTDNKKTKDADLWGTITTTDTSDSDQAKATISYPDEQLYAEVYVAANAAEIVAGTTSSGGGTIKELGSVSLKDSEAGSATTNLIIVGGSCVNTIASSLLGGAGCGASWETATGAGAGAFLIQTFERTGGKVATLVAGYNAEDTRNAAKVLTTDATIDLSSGKKYKSTSATTVAMVTETTTTPPVNTTA